MAKYLTEEDYGEESHVSWSHDDDNYDNIEINDENENERPGVNNNMARSFASVASESVSSKYTLAASENNPNQNQSTVKPVFIKESDIFGLKNPPKEFWVTHVELYKSIGSVVKPQCIRGIQRINKMWRIYLDNDNDRLKLLTEGMTLRDKSIPFYNYNPRNPVFDSKLVKVRVQRIPLSADDGQIERAISIRGIEVLNITRERLRVDTKLTNCETGDRLILCKKFQKPLPKTMKIGKYLARVVHYGQPKDTDVFLCSKCLEHGHTVQNCNNAWKCRKCNQSGHKMMDCPEFLAHNMAEQASDETLSQQSPTDTQETLPPDSEQHQLCENEDREDSDQEDTLQSHSQSILLHQKQTNRKQKQSKDVKKKQNVKFPKTDSTTTVETNDKNLPKESSKSSNKSKSKGNPVTFQKQSELTNYITPQSRKSNQQSNRTPPTPPDRGSSKIAKS